VRDGVSALPVCWNDIRTAWQEEGSAISARELQERVRQVVTDSVRAHLVADVPVSVFLSGGIDSGVIAGLATELGASVEGITIGFEEFSGSADDEVDGARAIAAYYGFPNHVRMFSRAEFEQDTPRILEAMDQPSVDGVNTWFASKAAAERGYKVALSGIGGDELFFGYSLFRQLPRLAALARALACIPGRRELLARPFAALAQWRSQPKLAGVPEFADSLEGLYFLRRCLFLPNELPALMGIDDAREGLVRLGGLPPGMTSADARNDAAAVGLLETTHYLRNQLLRDSDWASMGHSLEMRTPLVDAKLLEILGPYSSQFIDGAGKAMAACSPQRPLPDTIINRPKTGFSLPMKQWLTDAADQRAWADLSLLNAPGTSWARRWGRIVVDRMTACT
jgi:asparagine synthase (glutamine-hydrolysing)